MKREYEIRVTPTIRPPSASKIVIPSVSGRPAGSELFIFPALFDESVGVIVKVDMRSSWPGLVVAMALLVATQHVRAQEQGQFILAMSDDKGVPVTSFAPSDLEVFEDGKPAKVVKVEPRPQSSLKVTLALDNGRQLGDVLVHVRAAAKEFVKTLPPGVEVTLMTTAPVPRTAVKATTNREALMKGIDAIAPDSTSGRSIEAIQDVARGWRKTQGDLVLVLLASTFTAELVKKADAEEAFNQLKMMRAVVHAVLFSPANAQEGEAQRILTEQVARETRGRFELIGSYLQLNVLSDIGNGLARTATGGQFVVTIQRPAGATGKIGALSLSPGNGLQAGKITRMQ